jgi:DNA-binding NtrC family response regulator
MVKAFATQADGAVNLVSAEGKGTTVTLYLPLSKSRHERPDAVLIPEQNASRELVLLVVDDDSHLQTVLTRSLQVLGYDAFGASSVDAARQVATQLQRLDVLVADSLLRDSTAPALVTELTVLHPRLKVVFMSGYAEGDLAMATEHDAPVLQKPFPLVHLDETIQKLRADLT